MELRGTLPSNSTSFIYICDTIDWKPFDTNDTFVDINAIVYVSEAVVEKQEQTVRHDYSERSKPGRPSHFILILI